MCCDQIENQGYVDNIHTSVWSDLLYGQGSQGCILCELQGVVDKIPIEVISWL